MKPRAILLALVPLAFLAVFYFYPLAGILGASLSQAEPAAPWQTVFNSPGLRGVIGFTFWQALLSTLLTLLLGLPGAFLLAHYDFPGKSLFRALTAVPFVMPTLVVAAAFNALMGPNGWVNTAIMELFGLENPPLVFVRTFPAILTAHVFYNLTIVLRLVGDYWARLDHRLGQAARVLGASRWEALRRITIPLLTPAIAAAALLVFIFDFSSFAVVLVLGGPRFSTLETEIFYQTTGLGDFPVAAVLSLIQLACTLGLTVAYSRLSAVVARPVDQRSEVRSLPRLPGRRTRFGLAARITIFLTLLFTTAPLAALAGRSMVNLSPERTRTGTLDRGLTGAFYISLLDTENAADALGAASVSLGYAVITVSLALAFGLPTAWLLARRNEPINRLIDPLLMLPLGTSAVTLGLGFIVTLDQPPLDLRTSPLLVPLAHTLVAFPFVVRSMTPALSSIRPRLRHAAAVLGASPWQVIREVDLPLVGRAAAVAAAFAFSISLGEFGATALVTRPEFQTIPTVIYRLLGRPGALNYGQALALSTILMLLTLGAMLAIERFRVDGGEF